jgi:hypothetical protein
MLYIDSLKINKQFRTQLNNLLLEISQALVIPNKPISILIVGFCDRSTQPITNLFESIKLNSPTSIRRLSASTVIKSRGIVIVRPVQ